MWILQEDDKSLPEWLTNNLRSVCECGSQMENFYNKKGEITARRCSNTKCPYMMAEKVVMMCDILKVKGIGSSTALKIIRGNHLSSHFGEIPYILEEKPSVSLYDFMRMTFIRGIDTGWSAIAREYENLDDLLKMYNGKFAPELKACEDEIRNGASFFKIKGKVKTELAPIVTGTVMISGNIKGYSSRNDFIYTMNSISRGAIRIAVSESKRKTGVMALIQESDTPNRGKAECALSNGIPIMTPEQFTNHVQELVMKELKRRGVNIPDM